MNPYDHTLRLFPQFENEPNTLMHNLNIDKQEHCYSVRLPFRACFDNLRYWKQIYGARILERPFVKKNSTL
jgi:hypothetical protein